MQEISRVPSTALRKAFRRLEESLNSRADSTLRTTMQPRDLHSRKAELGLEDLARERAKWDASTRERVLSGLARQKDIWEQWSLGWLGPGWVYAMQRRLEHGRGWVVAELRIFPESDLSNSARMNHWIAEPLGPWKIPTGGLTASQLRRISFHSPLTRGLDGLMKAAKTIAQSYRKKASNFRRGSDTDLARIAEVYVALLASRRPTAECARQLGLSPSWVRDAIRHARERELLTPSRQGVAGGELTPKALALLQSRSRKQLARKAEAELQPNKEVAVSGSTRTLEVQSKRADRE